MLDSQSVKSAVFVNKEVGYDAAKLIKGRKRHLTVDCLGLVMRVLVTKPMYPNERVEKRVELGESDDARTDESTLFGVGRGWIFRKSLLDLGYGYPALGPSSGDSTQGTAEVCLVAETMGR